MAKPLERPDWFPLDIYSKKLSLEEWTFEIFKRVMFNNDTIPNLIMVFPDSNRPPEQMSLHLLTHEERIAIFMECIKERNKTRFLEEIKLMAPNPIFPISAPSITDVFIMFNNIISSDWYIKNHKKYNLVKLIEKIHRGETLNDKETLIFMEFQFKAWDNTESEDNKISHPNEKTRYMNGIPAIINQHFSKDDASSYLSSLLTDWTGKIHELSTSFDSWNTYQILAFFDLTVWFKLNHIKAHRTCIYSLIWPGMGRRAEKHDGYVNKSDDIGDIHAKVLKVISDDALRTLMMATANNIHYEERLAAKKQANKLAEA